ncbi:hypothetical protein BH20ACT23_BH20ACT23_02520 [soil metagenome]
MNRHNVMMLVVDSLRADAVTRTRLATPTLDALGSRGALFTQCIATCTTTTPSFSSILTGCYPPRHGMRGLKGYKLSPAVHTMAEVFAQAGYATHAEVTGPLVDVTGIQRGFSSTRYRKARGPAHFDWLEPVLERVRSTQSPWFLLVHIWEVHRPYRTPEGFAKHNDRSAYEASVAAADAALSPLFSALDDNTIAVVTGDHGEEYPHTKTGVFLRGAARRGRRLLKTSKWAGRLDEALLSLEVGHGFALTEELVRVPLIMAGPGIDPRTIHQQVRHVDLLPTLIEQTGIGPPPEPLDGRSLVSLLRGASLDDEAAYMEAVGVRLQGRSLVGARTPDWKLLIKGGRGRALYRLGSRPNEKKDLRAQYPEETRRLEEYIERVAASGGSESGMTKEEEESVEKHLQDLGYM